MVNYEAQLEDIARALAFAIFNCFHIWDCDPEVAHFMCPRCRAEFTFDKAKDEKYALPVLTSHLGMHLDEN